MKHIYSLRKTDGICDIDQVLNILRSVPGVQSAALLEGEPRVVIVSDPHAPLDQLNEALSKLVPCKLEEERVQSE